MFRIAASLHRYNTSTVPTELFLPWNKSWQRFKHLSPTRSFLAATISNQQRAVSDNFGPQELANDALGAQGHDLASSESEPQVPWYLEVETPSQERQPLLDRQRIPALPPFPPPILSELLHHVSVDLGLDDLTVIDLRDVDPPPALGANLVMMLATARSEKHLHVSADRFCKWLRATRNINATADGLIGRGELKLKLRRKMRRAKLLSRVGASSTTDSDDGIRTGWICVSVRSVKDGRPASLHQDLQNDYVGFGADGDTANIIVQMLTSEKRNELDLEGLWGRLDQRAATLNPPYSDGIEARKSLKNTEQSQANHIESSNPINHSSSFRGTLGQSRYLHTQSRGTSTMRHRHPDLQSITSPAFRPLLCRCWISFPQPVRGVRTGARVRRPLQSVHLNSKVPQRHFNECSARPMYGSEAAAPLSNVRNPAKSSLFPDLKQYEDLLYGYACEHTARKQDWKSHVSRLLSAVQATYVAIPSTIFENGIIALAQPPVSERDLEDIVGALEGLVARGLKVPSKQFRSTVQVALLAAPQSTSISKHAYTKARVSMNTLFGYAPIDDELEAMHQAADAAKWDEFWAIWRSIPRSMRSRPPQAYCTMFRRMAMRQHQAEIMRCLRECVPEMHIEEPPVEMDLDIAHAIKLCLSAARVGQPGSGREWEQLLARCEQTLAPNS